jgi:hypothetical protein
VPGPVIIVLVVVLVLDIERGLGMQCRNNPRARIDGTPNALGEAVLEDENDDEDEDDCEGRWRAHSPPSSCLLLLITDY